MEVFFSGASCCWGFWASCSWANFENIDQLLGYFQEVALWSPESQLAFVIDCGLSPQSANDCRRWCQDKKRVTFCTQKEFQEICKGVQDTVY